MKKTLSLSLALFAAALAPLNAPLLAQSTMPTHPTVTVDGQNWTPLGIVTRNMGTAIDQETAFPPHHVIGNIYYVGTKTLSSFLVVTPKGNILIDTTYERNVPVIEKSIKELGFKVGDTKIILGNHAHGDHMEGDALAKEDAPGAMVEAMAEDIPALKNIRPEGKEHPIDRIFHDGDTVALGGTVLTAHLWAGHTRGCTAFTTDEVESGKTYHVVFGCSLRSPNVITAQNVAEFTKSFPAARATPCDVMLGDHPSQYGMIAKYQKLMPGQPNPFIDQYTCHHEIDIEQAMFDAVLKEQGGPLPAPAPAAPKP